MAPPRDLAWYKDENRALTALVNDFLLGIAHVANSLPWGTAALIEDIQRVIARIAVERFFSENPPPAKFANPLDTVRFCVDQDLIPILKWPPSVDVDCTKEGHIQLTYDSQSCPFRPHCETLTREKAPTVCTRRIFVEQTVSYLTGHEMASIALPPVDSTHCTFSIFPTSDKMLRPIERIAASFSNLAQERSHAKDALSRLQARYKLILETIGDAIVVFDSDNKVTYLNPRACGVFALKPEDALGKLFQKNSPFGRVADLCVDAADKLGGWVGDMKIENTSHGKMHNIYLARFSPVLAANRSPLGTLVLLKDITGEEILRRALEVQTRNLETQVDEKTRQLTAANTELEKLAGTDALTGLANRRMFQDILDREVKRASRYNHRIGILMVDIDNFKTVNDQLGHQKGDDVLVGVAGILADSLRDSDLLARWGGDEFIILLPEASSTDCLNVAHRIRETFDARKNSLDLHPCTDVDLSVGCDSGTPTDFEHLIATADTRMYARKAEKKAR